MEPTPTPSLKAQIALIATLTPDSKGRWGVMEVDQMLRHCSEFVVFCLGKKKASLFSRLMGRLFGKRLLRFVLSRNPWNFPKNLRTLPEIKQRAGERYDLAAEKDRLTRLITEVTALEGSIRHPLYGKMEPTLARHLCQLHTAYHLRQFGLIADVPR